MKSHKSKSLGFLGLTLLFGLFATSCQDGDDRLKEKAAIEGAETARKQVEAEKQYQGQKALEMETDLTRRHRFYSAVSGVFEGTMKDSVTEESFHVRITLTPSLPPYRSDRVRAWDEIVQDLNNLYFNAQVIQWDTGGDPSSGIAFGCVFQNIKPDLEKGIVNLAASDCPSFYSISLAEDDGFPNGSLAPIREHSTRIAADVLDQRLDKIIALKGYRQVTKSSAVFRFAVKRMEP